MALSALAVVRLVSAFHVSTLSGKKCNFEIVTPEKGLSRTNLEKDTTDLSGQDWIVLDSIPSMPNIGKREWWDIAPLL